MGLLYEKKNTLRSSTKNRALFLFFTYLFFPKLTAFFWPMATPKPGSVKLNFVSLTLHNDFHIEWPPLFPGFLIKRNILGYLRAMKCCDPLIMARQLLF